MNLSQKQWRKVLLVAQGLNDGLDDRPVRERAGRGLLDLLSADHFASYVWDHESRAFARPVCINMEPDNLQQYDSYYQFHDPITYKLQPYRRAVSVNEVMEQRKLIRTEFFNDFLHKDGLYYGINIYVYDTDNNNIGDFRIWRKKHRDNFGRRDLEILDLIAPHFRNAMSNIALARNAPAASVREQVRRRLSDDFGLTRREREIALEVLDGQSDKSICSRKHISMSTLRTHLRHVFDKLDIKSRSELCGRALFEKRRPS